MLLALAGCADQSPTALSPSAADLSTAASTQADVLILGTTEGDMANIATSVGLTSRVVTEAEWGAMTTADFAKYKALVLGDPYCSGPGTSSIAAAIANKNTWGAAINGNVILIGTDERYHGGSTQGEPLAKGGLKFAADAAGKTGMYISLSCYYHDTAAKTPVSVLDPFGSFTVQGVGCFNDAHIVATHPALAGITDATLSDWSCSVHEAFDGWPSTFEVLAIAENVGDSYTAPDGTKGTPYILARGEGLDVISDIALEPENATNPVGTSHTLTATVTEGGSPLSGITVTFTVETGPHAGTTGNGVTNSSGKATFSYTGTKLGTDVIRARFTRNGKTQSSKAVTKTWIASGGGTNCGAFCFMKPTPGVSVDHTLDGAFDGNRSLSVLICQLSGSECNPGPWKAGFFTDLGSNRVKSDAAAGAYWVKFKANAFGFDPAAQYRIQVFGNGKLIGKHDTSLPKTGNVEIRFRIRK